VNAVLEAAAKVKAPVIVQFSNGGAVFTAGKGLKLEGQQAAILGAISGAKHVHAVAEAYGVPVILHTDHAAKKLLPWIDGLLDAGEKHFAETGKPLFSSHMLDLSEESLEENINIWQLDFLAGNSFVEDGAIIDRKLNVAITRARKQMIMTGNPEILRNNQIFSELMNYVKEKGGYF
jgi:hypothetical protein